MSGLAEQVRGRATANRRGIPYMLGYLVLFVAANAATKHLTLTLPLVEIAYFRYALAIPVIWLVLARRGDAFRINSLGAHVGRGLLAAIGSICGYAAIATLPLGDATVLFYVAPLLTAAGAALLLGERADLATAICVAAAFAGVVMVAQPNLGSGSGLAVAAGVANAICAASGVLLVRWLRSTEQPLSLALTTSIVCAASLFLPAQLSWSDRASDVMLELAALGIMGGSATLLLNLAYSSSPAPLLASLDFLAVPGSMIAGSVLWDQHPSWIAAGGCAVIVTAGLSNAVRPRISSKLFSQKVGRTP